MKSDSTATRYARYAGVAACLVGLACWCGWLLDIVPLTAVIPGLAQMKPVTGLCCMLTGGCLILRTLAPAVGPPGLVQRSGDACALAVAAIGMVTLIGNLIDQPLGLENLLFRQSLAATGRPHPGRMTLAACTAFSLLGVGLLALRRGSFGRELSQWCGLAATLIGAIGVAGYTYDAPSLYQLLPYYNMAFSTAALLVLLGVGLVFAPPTGGLAEQIVSDKHGGMMARRLLPIAIAAPILAGCLQLVGVRAGWFTPNGGLAISVAALSVISAAVVWLVARALNRVDAERREAQRRSMSLAEGQKRVLEMIATGQPLVATLDELVRMLEAQSPDMLCSILMLEPDGVTLRHVVGPSLPAKYNSEIDGVKIGPAVGSCGTSAWRRQPVFVQDIASDPLWAEYRDLALAHGLRACWSSPIFDPARNVLGTFAIYYRQPGAPQARHLQLIEIATHTAAICILRHRFEHDLRESESRFRQLVESLPGMVWTADNEGRAVFLGRPWTLFTGASEDQLNGAGWQPWLHPEDRQHALTLWMESVASGTDFHAQFRIRRHDGAYRWFESNGVPLRDQSGRIVKWVGTNTDITERKISDEAQARSQKLESLGRLAGGIAHDFNNILLAIGGNAMLIEESLSPDHPARAFASEVTRAVSRASDLVNRILAFSRPGEVKRELVDLRPVVEEALGLVRATLPPQIEYRTVFAPDVPRVEIASTQIHQIILNVVTNAAHAIGRRPGLIEVSLTREDINQERLAESPDLRAGRYACITVRDTGSGMDRDTIARIFDPFFTTKPVGQGTGLGLSVVHGIMRSCGGAISVHSEPGRGTEFRFYFPVTTRAVAPRAA